MSQKINANISHSFYYTSVGFQNEKNFIHKIGRVFKNAQLYKPDAPTDNAYMKDMQIAERFLHGGGQTYRVTRFFINDFCPDMQKAGFAGWCIMLSYICESDILSLSFHYTVHDNDSDDIIALRQSGAMKKYDFGSGSYSCADVAEKLRSSLGLQKHIEQSYLCEITKLGDYETVSDIEKYESPLLYGLLSGDEGYKFVPEEMISARLANYWGSRSFTRIYAGRQAFLFINMLGTPAHNQYIRRQEEFGTAVYGGCNEYFLLGECPLTVNHGILFSVEFVMMLKALVNEVLNFQTEYSRKRGKSYYKRIRETHDLRRKIIKVLEKVENTEIAEIGELSEMLLTSQHIAPIVDQVKYLLELLENDLTLVYSEHNNMLVTFLTVLGLIIAIVQIFL